MIPEIQRGKQDKQMVETFTIVMREMTWSWDEFMETPVPVFLHVLRVLHNEGKERKRQEQKIKAQSARRR